MSESEIPGHRDEIEKLIAQFYDSDGIKRQRARLTVIQFGWEAIPALTAALVNPNEHVRWEAAKALGSIEDPTAAGPLVQALMDESQDVRWAAAESLIALDRAALEPLLESLTRNFFSIWLRVAAHHILHVLKDKNRLTAEEQEVFETFKSLAPEVEVPWAAEAALQAHKLNKK